MKPEIEFHNLTLLGDWYVPKSKIFYWKITPPTANSQGKLQCRQLSKKLSHS